MKKNTVKIILDSVMAFVLMFMYKKGVLGLGFHEIAGIAVCLLFIIHILLNRKWVAAATKALFSKETTGKVRACYIVDLLIALSFLGLLVTGLGISKIVFKQIAFLGNAGNPFHFFFGGLSLILLGIHLGLHWDWIKISVLKFYAKSPKWVRSVLTLAAIGFSGFGLYSLINSSMGRWLTAVFAKSGVPAGMGPGNGMGPGAGAGLHLGNGTGMGMHTAEQITVSSVVSTFFIFLAIVVLFAFVTVVIEWLATRKSKKQAAIK